MYVLTSSKMFRCRAKV